MTAQARLFNRRLLTQAVDVAGDPTSDQIAVARTWAQIAADPSFRSENEKPHQGRFLTEFFGQLLGYRAFGAAASGYELIAEQASSETRGGQTPDGRLGFFGVGDGKTVAVIELKKPAVNLDTKQPSRADRRTPVEQGFGYVSKFDGCRWVIVSNFVTVRLYWAVRGEGYYWDCDVAELEDPAKVAELVRVLHRRNLLGANPGQESATATLAVASRSDETQITEAFYGFFKRSRAELFDAVVASNPPPTGVDRTEFEPALLKHTQTILDRLLFVCFAEDTDLLPRNLLRDALDHAGAGFASTTRWQQLRGLFSAIDTGLPDRGIDGYNGGLFAHNATLDDLDIDDDALTFVYEMSSYDFSEQLGVEVLGRVFERSIVDIEALHAEIDPDVISGELATSRSRRSQEGVFYTPDWVTRFLATRTIGAWVDDRFAQMRTEHGVEAVPEAHSVRRRTAEIEFWEQWQNELRSIRVLDPACGSGAFLVAAFDALYAEYERANAALAEFRGGQAGLFDPNRDILESNLYGVDINNESVEITRLSLWLKTARRGRTLTSLSDTIRCGNSLVHPVSEMSDSSSFDALPGHDRSLAFDWRTAFAEVFDPTARPDGRTGFDIVLGNPPYVRGEWLEASFKDYLKDHYRVFGRRADLLVYFYERALGVMADSGRLGFIVSNKWLKSGYGEPLRRYLSSNARLDGLIDFGHSPIFQDADTFPIITLLSPHRHPEDGSTPSSEVLVAAVPRDALGAAGLSQLIDDRGFRVDQHRFDHDAWSLEAPDVQELIDALEQHPTLNDALGVEPLFGIKTGMNDAYIINHRIRNQLIAEHPPSAEIIHAMARGSTVARWSATSTEYLIGLASSDDRRWPWSDADDPERVFADTYPSIYRWLTTDQRRDELRQERLRTRSDQGRYWWELRRCQYYDKFAEPKLIYTDIAWQPEVAADDTGLFINNSAYFIPGADPWTAAVLNSPLIWWYAWRTFQHGKDEALRWFTASVSAIPYAFTSHTEEAAAAVEKVVQVATHRRAAHQATLDWLRSECNVVRPGNKLGDPGVVLTADEFVSEAKRVGRFEATSSALAALRREHEQLSAAVTSALGHEHGLELEIAKFVEDAYGLTDRQKRLVRNTAPPRTPLYAPAS